MKLIFGANGQLGTEFKEIFDKLNIEYVATDKEKVDITDMEYVREYILNLSKHSKIDAIINCAAYNQVEKAEEERDSCFKLNMEAAVNLANIALELDADFITYSTDFVFAGNTETYMYNDNIGFTEEDETMPLSTYAQSKYEGEVLINQLIQTIPSKSKVYIIRTSWLFGKGNDNFIKKIIRSSKVNTEIHVVDDQISSPTYSKDLAEYTLKLLNKKAESGLYHFTNDGTASKYEQAKYILDKISWAGKLIPTKTDEFIIEAKRPNFSKLNCKKIKDALGEGIPHWKDAMDRYFREENF